MSHQCEKNTACQTDTFSQKILLPVELQKMSHQSDTFQKSLQSGGIANLGIGVYSHLCIHVCVYARRSVEEIERLNKIRDEIRNEIRNEIGGKVKD